MYDVHNFPWFLYYLHKHTYRLTFTIGLLDEIITGHYWVEWQKKNSMHMQLNIFWAMQFFFICIIPIIIVIMHHWGGLTFVVVAVAAYRRVGSRTVWVLCNRPHFFFAFHMHCIAKMYKPWSSDVDEKSAWKHWMAVVGPRANKQKRTWKFFINKLMHLPFPVPYKFFHNNTITSRYML